VLTLSISARSAGGYRSIAAAAGSSESALVSVLNMRMISGDSLLTMVRRFLSQSTGTVTRPV